MTSALLTDHFQTIMENAQINDLLYDFDATEDSHSFYLESEFNRNDVIWSGAGGYNLCAVPGDDAPTVLLFHDSRVVGLYRDMMAWVDPRHRGKGLGATMIVEFAEYFGEHAFRNEEDDPSAGLGFTIAGFAAHRVARTIATERLEVSGCGPKI